MTKLFRCLVFSLVLLLAACGGEQDGPEAQDPATGEEQDPAGSDDPTTEPGADASADDWPSDPIEIALSASPGSSADRFWRTASPFLEDELGVPVNVQNREGGGGAIANNHVLRQPPDGQTLLGGTFPYFNIRIGQQEGTTLDDWDYIGAMNEDSLGLMGAIDSYPTLNELLDAWESGEHVNIGLFAGDPTAIGLEALKSSLELESGNAEFVYYDGGGELRVDLLGGHIDAGSANAAGFSDIHESGDGRFLAFFADERLDTHPDVPTVREVVEQRGGDAESIPTMSVLRALQVPTEFAEQYPARYERIAATLRELSGNDSFVAAMREVGFEVSWVPGDTMRQRSKEFASLLERYPDVFPDIG